MSSADKLSEASFFLELLDALKERKRPLTNRATPMLEVSYLLGAILNSLYSALEQAKPIAGVEAVKAYKAAHSTLLGGQGIRNMTIHEKHVGTDYSGYIPSSGNAVNFDLRITPLLVEEEQAVSTGVVLHMGASHYIEHEGKLAEVTELCFQQFYELREFLISRDVVTQEGAQEGSSASGGPDS